MLISEFDYDLPEELIAQNALEKRENSRMLSVNRVGQNFSDENFYDLLHFLKTGEHLPGPTLADRVEVCRQHLDFSIRWKGEKLGIFEMRRHYTNYFKGLENFKPYRQRLVTADTYAELLEIMAEIVDVYAVEALAGNLAHVR